MDRKDPIARAARSTLAIGAIVACLLAVSGSRAGAQDLSAEPPTIEKIIIEKDAALLIEGEGRPGNIVEVIAGDGSLGEVVVPENGRWRLDLKTGLKPGTHQIRASARADAAGSPASGDEIRVAIPSELGARAVVEYDGTTDDADRLTRQRAEALAQNAGQAFDEITRQQQSVPSMQEASRKDEPRRRTEEAPSGGDSSALTVVIEWLKRSARTYREEVVQKLGVAKPLPEETAEETTARDAQTAAGAIARERADADARRLEVAQADAARKAAEADRAAAETARKEALKRKQAEDLARKKAEADKRIAEELERLKKAREEADRAKAHQQVPASAAPAAPTKAKVTLERFYLPGEKRPARETAARVARSGASGPCAVGRVVLKKGRRWYVTGADDTLWDIAERFYGSGLAYPRIYRANRKRLSSPHVVRPCLALRLPGRA